MCSGRNEATIRLKQPKLRKRNNDVEFFRQDRQIMINQIDKFEIEKKKKRNILIVSFRGKGRTYSWFLLILVIVSFPRGCERIRWWKFEQKRNRRRRRSNPSGWFPMLGRRRGIEYCDKGIKYGDEGWKAEADLSFIWISAAKGEGHKAKWTMQQPTSKWCFPSPSRDEDGPLSASSFVAFLLRLCEPSP